MESDSIECKFAPCADSYDLGGEESAERERKISGNNLTKVEERQILEPWVREGDCLSPEPLPDTSDYSELGIEQRIIDMLKVPYRVALVDEGITPYFAAKERKKLFNVEITRNIKLSGSLPEDFKLPAGYRIIAQTDDEILIEVSSPDYKLIASSVEAVEKIFHTQEVKLQHKHDFNIHTSIPEPDMPDEELIAIPVDKQ